VAPVERPAGLPHDVLVAMCDGCGLVVEDGDGYLVVDVGATRDRRLLRMNPDDPANDSHGPIKRLIGPPRVLWQVTHSDCLPETGYELEISQVRTLRQLVTFTAHLMEKQWLQDTNWHILLREAAQGKGSLRLARAH
jgi:hypothetical protein